MEKIVFIVISIIFNFCFSQAQEYVNETYKKGVEYNDKGDVIGEGKQKKRLKEGLWIIYYPQKHQHIKEKGYYKNGIRIGEWEVYSININGKLIWKGNYVDGKKNGDWTNFVSEEKIRYGKMVDDKSHGTWTTIKNDHVSLIQNFINGEREGIEIEFFETGDTARVTKYAFSKREGNETRYYQNGKVAFVIGYSNDQMHGIYLEYSDNGKLLIEGNYRDGFQIGEWIYKDRDGRLLKKGEYSNGEMIGYWYVTNREDGKLLSEGYKNMDVKGGSLENEWKYYYNNHNIKEQGNYKKNNKEGVWKFYNQNGKLYKTETYSDGNLLTTNFNFKGSGNLKNWDDRWLENIKQSFPNLICLKNKLFLPEYDFGRGRWWRTSTVDLAIELDSEIPSNKVLESKKFGKQPYAHDYYIGDSRFDGQLEYDLPNLFNDDRVYYNYGRHVYCVNNKEDKYIAYNNEFEIKDDLGNITVYETIDNKVTGKDEDYWVVSAAYSSFSKNVKYFITGSQIHGFKEIKLSDINYNSFGIMNLFINSDGNLVVLMVAGNSNNNNDNKGILRHSWWSFKEVIALTFTLDGDLIGDKNLNLFKGSKYDLLNHSSNLNIKSHVSFKGYYFWNEKHGFIIHFNNKGEYMWSKFLEGILIKDIDANKTEMIVVGDAFNVGHLGISNTFFLSLDLASGKENKREIGTERDLYNLYVERSSDKFIIINSKGYLYVYENFLKQDIINHNNNLLEPIGVTNNSSSFSGQIEVIKNKNRIIDLAFNFELGDKSAMKIDVEEFVLEGQYWNEKRQDYDRLSPVKYLAKKTMSHDADNYLLPKCWRKVEYKDRSLAWRPEVYVDSLLVFEFLTSEIKIVKEKPKHYEFAFDVVVNLGNYVRFYKNEDEYFIIDGEGDGPKLEKVYKIDNKLLLRLMNSLN